MAWAPGLTFPVACLFSPSANRQQTHLVVHLLNQCGHMQPSWAIEPTVSEPAATSSTHVVHTFKIHSLSISLPVPAPEARYSPRSFPGTFLLALPLGPHNCSPHSHAGRPAPIVSSLYIIQFATQGSSLHLKQPRPHDAKLAWKVVTFNLSS